MMCPLPPLPPILNRDYRRYVAAPWLAIIGAYGSLAVIGAIIFGVWGR